MSACRRRPPAAAARCTRPARHARRRAQRGFAFATAIFVLVILAGFAAFVLQWTANAAATSAVAVQGARAYQAAQAGLQWAGNRLRDPDGTLAPGTTALTDCFASPRTLAMPAGLDGFTVTLTCTRYPAGASPGYHVEDDRRLRRFTVTATASAGTPGAADYVERRLEAKIEHCKDPNAAGPAHAC